MERIRRMSRTLEENIGYGAQLRQRFRTQVQTIAGFSTAARERHWFPRLFWITLSLTVSAVCIYDMMLAWEQFIAHGTIVQVGVRIKFGFLITVA